MKKEEDVELLQRIANHLIINSGFIDNLGLLDGKMGIVIFFYHYSRYTKKPLYEELAGVLLDDIFDEIHDKLPINFENGYLGIGWGIEYLAKQKFIKGNTNDILEDIDKKIMERDVRRISDMSLNTGLEGVFHYILSRYCDNNDTDCHFDRQYLEDLTKVANNLSSTDISKSLSLIINCFKLRLLRKESNYIISDYFRSFNIVEISQNSKIYEMKLGLAKGCVGLGLKLMNV